MSKHKMYAAITKVDDNGDGTIDVHGVASTETRDAQGESVTKGCMEAALPDYFLHGTGALRAMHQPIAAGYVYKAEVNAEGQTMISAKVVDPVEVLKCTTGVYKGFSIGGSKLAGGYDTATKTITKMRLTEISLVDKPANPEAVITMWKGEDIDQNEQVVDVTVSKANEAHVTALADLINAGKISVEDIVKLANAEVAKVEPVVEVAKVEPVAEVAKVEPVAVVMDVAKGLYSVQSLAGVLREIQYLASDNIYEAQSEGDGSAVPASIIAWLKTGAEILVAMTKEETDEMLSNLDDMSPSILTITEMSEKADEIRKALSGKTDMPAFIEAAAKYMPVEDVGKAFFVAGATIASVTEEVVKAGARNNAKDKVKLQSMHDNSVSLGAECNMKKADATMDVAKVAGLEADIAKLQGECDALSKLVEAHNALPAPSKAVLRIINKGDDVGGENETKKEDGPVLKADGSIDQEQTVLQQIKKAHQNGGVRFLR
jgi:hypothetical protein